MKFGEAERQTDRQTDKKTDRQQVDPIYRWVKNCHAFFVNSLLASLAGDQINTAHSNETQYIFGWTRAGYAIHFA
jgi:hypothetical protein